MLFLSFALAKADQNSLEAWTAVSGAYQANLISSNLDNTSFCQPEVVEVSWLSQEKEQSLIIGSNLVFSKVNLASFKRAADSGCTYVVTNTTSAKFIEQVWNQECKDKKLSFKKIHRLQQDANGFTYTFMVDDKKMVCSYKKVLGNIK